MSALFLVSFREPDGDPAHFFVEKGHGLAADRIGDPEIRFRDPCGDPGQRVGIAAHRNGIAQRVLKAVGFVKRLQSHRHRAPAACVESILRPELIQIAAATACAPLTPSG